LGWLLPGFAEALKSQDARCFFYSELMDKFMSRVVIHNHMSRNIGRFRATAPVRDRGSCPCGCGGACNHNHDREGYAKAELGIDVTYAKGAMGRQVHETRHYTIPNVTIDPRGHAPEPAFVAAELRKQPGHQDMIHAGWSADDVQGYYKREQRDVGRKIS